MKIIPQLFSTISAMIISLQLLATPTNTYLQTNLVSTSADARLKNPWGLTFSKSGNLIVADNNSSAYLATAYFVDGSINSFNIANISGLYNPTGLVTNYNHNEFLIGIAPNQKHARLLFATENSKILAFNRLVDSGVPQVVIDRSSQSPAPIYTGLTLAIGAGTNKQYIFAADFRNGNIDVFDNQFAYVKSLNVTTPAGYAPFNIQNINGLLYVTYAQQASPPTSAPVTGAGLGYVLVFNSNGYVSTLVSQGALNAPWGIALAPSDFGAFSGALLVGNQGDGKINAYSLSTGSYLGTLNNTSNAPIVIPGLWSIKFEPHAEECPELYFTSGPTSTTGVVGVIKYQSQHQEL